MADMQLGATISGFLTEVAAEQPDIIGISATFGQHDLVESLGDGLQKIGSEALLVFGGSLSALNAARLLDRYPSALVARGPGEETIRDIVEHWHGDRPLSAIRGIHWLSNGELKSSMVPSNASSGGCLPELDLLEKILEQHGVMQLESSRGCTHACSFCPREHKGVWAGDEAGQMSAVLDAVDEIFEDHSGVARKIFLVDEEFVGKDSEGEGLKRASAIADELWSRGFRWETSSRVDQVYRPDRDKAWHLERLRFWAQLRDHGLDRCLFGIESGVDSVLKRFNKRTTARQNVLALRLLSACGIPIRCTYITFDHLMTLSELRESYHFQGRTDLLLRPQASMSYDEMFEAVHDDSFAAENSRRAPFHDQITYMLVSMECLAGSPYLAKVQAAGSSISPNRSREQEFPLVVTDDLLTSALGAALADRDCAISQVMINGGNFQDPDRSFLYYARLCKAARRVIDQAGRAEVELHLIVYPPADLDLLTELAGLDLCVAMNMEVFDPVLFQQFCPGKHAVLGQRHTLRALARAAEIMGAGNVFSIVVGGLESQESMEKGMELLIGEGVIPIINVFHPDPETPLASRPAPPVSRILEMGKSLQEVFGTAAFARPFYLGCGRNSLDTEAHYRMF